MQKFLDRCIVEEGDPEDENYKVKDRFFCIILGYLSL